MGEGAGRVFEKVAWILKLNHLSAVPCLTQHCYHQSIPQSPAGPDEAHTHTTPMMKHSTKRKLVAIVGIAILSLLTLAGIILVFVIGKPPGLHLSTSLM